MKIDLKQKKVLFLGYGAVAKCVWNYFDEFFIYKKQNIFLVDRTKTAFTGPKLKILKKEQKIVLNVSSNTFDDLIDHIGLRKQDIIIDLSTSTPTYYIIKQCFIRDLHYINTSIEDCEDDMHGSSIDCQQQMVKSISKEFKKPKSTILTEFGQNPGLIQHYVLYALNQLSNKNDYSHSSLQKVIRDHKIGTILMSEIDNMKKTKNVPTDLSKIYNTWSVNGYFFEALDKTELVCGKKNKFVHPTFPNIDSFNSLLYPSDSVFFLKSTGIKSTLNSICPVLENDKIKIQNFRGKLLHHGEMFELARYFGDYSPFMSYVYQTNSYLDESINTFYKKFPDSKENDDDLWMYVNQDNTFHIFNGQEVSGHDSIGCTIFCGEEKIEKIYWCGSILSSSDPIVKEDFTPTIVQVAAGVLSGLSFILENKPMGLIEAVDMDTNYVLEKSKPMLGKFLFMELPVQNFQFQFNLI